MIMTTMAPFTIACKWCTKSDYMTLSYQQDTKINSNDDLPCFTSITWLSGVDCWSWSYCIAYNNN
jgi:hypothetical protein